jgi:hypothetical protein
MSNEGAHVIVLLVPHPGFGSDAGITIHTINGPVHIPPNWPHIKELRAAAGLVQDAADIEDDDVRGSIQEEAGRLLYRLTEELVGAHAVR